MVSVIPSEFLRPTLARLRPHLHAGQIVVSATKGVEDHTFLRMTEVIADSLEPDPALLLLRIGALSGPSFALEVAQGQPTALTVAFSDPAVAARIQQEFSSETLRLYTSTDVIGVELGGALKNVIAIAAGSRRRRRPRPQLHRRAHHPRHRGDHPPRRSLRRRAAKPSPASPASAIWCSPAPARSAATAPSAKHSARAANSLRFSTSLGGKVAEGVRTTRAALGLARKHGIEMPITEQMELILNEGKDPREAIRDLMLRPGKDEH